MWWSIHLSSYCHLPFVVFIPFIVIAMSLMMIISLSSSQHLPFVLLITSSALAFVVACAFSSFVYLNIDTYLSWVVTSVVRFEPVTSPTAVQRIYHLCRWAFCFIFVSWSVLTVTWSSGLLHRCPAHYQLIFSFIFFPWSLLSLSWASSLSFCSPAHTIFFPYLLCLEPATSSTEAQHTTKCASQTAVVMWGIIFVYML